MFVCAITTLAQQMIDLSGQWQLELNANNKQTIILPNTLDGAGIGEVNTLEPKLSKPQLSRLTRKHSYIGVATYQREVNISQEMALKPLQVMLERVMWRSRLCVDGKDLGRCEQRLLSTNRCGQLMGRPNQS